MPFRILLTDEARTALDALHGRRPGAADATRTRSDHRRAADPAAARQVDKALRWLATNPRHPGLRTHRYHSLTSPFDREGQVFESYAQNRTPGALRLFWCYGKAAGDITVIAIVRHPD
jgi:hypothetical protein